MRDVPSATAIDPYNNQHRANDRSIRNNQHHRDVLLLGVPTI